jgi:hypothetical protein
VVIASRRWSLAMLVGWLVLVAWVLLMLMLVLVAAADVGWRCLLFGFCG